MNGLFKETYFEEMSIVEMNACESMQKWQRRRLFDTLENNLNFSKAIYGNEMYIMGYLDLAYSCKIISLIEMTALAYKVNPSWFHFDNDMLILLQEAYQNFINSLDS